MRVHYAIVAAAALCLPLGVSAQTMKPGLWETTNNMKGGGDMEKMQAQMQREMANMPPEQKKMMQDMMMKHGVQMGAGGMSVKTCMTKEMVERNEIPSHKGDCRTTKQEKTGNVLKFAVQCTNPPMTGDGQVTFTSPEAYNMKMVMHTKAEGKPQTMNMEASGKWLGADCGSIKPHAMPAGAKK